MNNRIVVIIAASLALASAVCDRPLSQPGTSTLASPRQQPPPIPPEEQPEGVEVLTRGPVNEAFDQPVTLQSEEGIVAPTEPPPNIDEVPPTERPLDDRYVWVPGYWSWDTERNDYIWVSACWRMAPPNTRWVPGYWTPVRGGWEWVSGFWVEGGSQEIDYLPAPPAPVDVEPPGATPYTDRVWVPGCWYWYHGRYVRRSGYWIQEQPGWVWVPSHYRWTPRGYVFIEGRWDYAVEQRGVLFAPVYFPRPVYSRVGFSYSPTIVIDLGLLMGNLFAYPRYGHYYFGDYYDDIYLRIGIYPRFDCLRYHTWYDPNYHYDRWRHHRTDPRWDEHRRQDYDRRRADANLRPPRTYHQQEVRMHDLPEPQRRQYGMARPIRAIAQAPTGPMKFRQINTEQRQQIAKDGSESRKFRDERARWEAPAAAPSVTPPGGEPRGPRAQPQESRRPDTPPGQARGPRGTVERATPPPPQREVQTTRPDRVKISAPPIASKSGSGRGAPPSPPGERRRQAEQSKGNKGGKPKQ